MENKIKPNSISPLFLASVLAIASFVPLRVVSPKEKHPVDQGPVIVCSEASPQYPYGVRAIAFDRYHGKKTGTEVSIVTQLTSGSPATTPASDGGLTPFQGFERTGLNGFGISMPGRPVLNLAGCLVAIPDKPNLDRFFNKIRPDQLPTQDSSAKLRNPYQGQIRFPNSLNRPLFRQRRV